MHKHWIGCLGFLLINVVYANDESIQLQGLNQRINLLESAFAPKTVEQVANTFAEAVTQRNGAVQYMLFCQELKQQYLPRFQESNWVSGTSSPSYANYKVEKTSAEQFNVHYTLTLQGKPAGTSLDQLKIIASDVNTTGQYYCITIYTNEVHLQ